MTPEQVEAVISWLDAQSKGATRIAVHDRSEFERQRARGRIEAYTTAANKLRAALESPL